jgi:hypothetical protein
VKLSHKLLLATRVLGILGVIFILLEQHHLYFDPGKANLDRFFTVLSICGPGFLLLAGAIVLFSPFTLWRVESPGKLALTGMALMLGAIMFALFAYEAFIFDGITTVRDGNGIFLFFAAPPTSPALLSGFLTSIAAVVRYLRPHYPARRP